jgi:hypothetical protein
MAFKSSKGGKQHDNNQRKIVYWPRLDFHGGPTGYRLPNGLAGQPVGIQPFGYAG